MSHTLEFVKEVFRDQLQMGERANTLTEESLILGAIPEFDSMAVVGVLAAIEEHLGVAINDDDISGEMFESVSSLIAFIDEYPVD